MSNISQVKVEGFQSLDPVTLDLGAFTVVVGPSSSGKSALIRALKYLFFFGRGSNFITRGKTNARIGILTDDSAVVLGKSERKSSYQVRDSTGEREFTKLGTSVPEAVQEALRGSELNFAGQFDRPFWFDESGAAVARDLGALTNVSMIYEAAREANRRRLTATSSVKAKEEQLLQIDGRLEEFADLDAREAEYARLCALRDAATAAVSRQQAIQHALEALGATYRALQDARADLDQQAPPSTEQADQAMLRYRQIGAVMTALAGLRQTRNDTEALIQRRTDDLGRAVELRDRLAEELGARCTLCGALPEHQHPELIGQMT